MKHCNEIIEIGMRLTKLVPMGICQELTGEWGGKKSIGLYWARHPTKDELWVCVYFDGRVEIDSLNNTVKMPFDYTNKDLEKLLNRLKEYENSINNI